MIKNQKKILLYNISFMKEAQIFNLCKELNIQTIKVKREDFGEVLGVVAGIKGIKSNGKTYRDTSFQREMMVFSGISSEELDVFLQRYNEKGIEKINLKAMLTPFNIKWTGEMLYKELLKEDNAMKQ